MNDAPSEAAPGSQGCGGQNNAERHRRDDEELSPRQTNMGASLEGKEACLGRRIT